MKKDNLITEIMGNKQNYYIIHYSCQSLNDNNEGLSPRVTSIVIQHLDTKQTVSFSTHGVAEELGIAKGKIIENFDIIEATLLTRFYSYVERSASDSYWIHWNMKSVVYGFEHLEHRYRLLTKNEPYLIDVKKRLNLSSMVAHKYGSNFADDPKLLGLMELNGGRHRDFLTGDEEVTAFKSGDYVRMLKSTMCKVNFYNMVLYKMRDNKLCTKNRSWRYKINKLYEHPIVQIISIVGVFGTAISLIVGLVQVIKSII
ncbi:TPA: hypothetical protein IAC10_04335 [Candidatus Scatousia excrementigallinarum]|uniref:Uncharacterized protein n=1 Tax=Candidatus Scatousia excrementigallinarum TaxID=2840935 RepID=A0A9D1EYP0_9BACT|nr:hypothetical protein [Candidatus Scatousia excrementigallinarum]